MDATTLAPAEWAALATAIHRSVVIGPVTVIVALSLAFVVSRLSLPTGAPAAWLTERRDRRSPGGRRPAMRPAGWCARSDPAQAAPGAEPCSSDEPECLSRGGFAPADVVALEALRRRVLKGELSECPARDERLVFARWLVEHDRLSG